MLLRLPGVHPTRRLGGLGGFGLRRLGTGGELVLDLADLLDQLQFPLPAGGERVMPGFQEPELGRQRLRGARVVPTVAVPGPAEMPHRLVAFEARPLALDPQHVAGDRLDRLGGAVLGQGHPGAGGVEDADRLVRELAAGDVAVREGDGAAHRLVEHPHPVVRFEVGGEAAQHVDRGRLVRLVHLDHLEAAGEGGVLLEVALVLGPGGGGDGAQLAPGEGGFQEVGRIPLARRPAGADHGVGLVDEQDDGGGRALDLVDHRAQPVLELPLDPGAGLEETEVEEPERDLPVGRRHRAGRDAEREPLDDGGLPHPRLAGQDGVVLPPPGEDVDDLADLDVPAADGVDEPGPGAGGQIDRVEVEGRGRRSPAGRPRRPALRRTLTARPFSPRPYRFRRRPPILPRAADQLGHVLAERLARDLAEAGGRLKGAGAQDVVVEKRQEEGSRADGTVPEVERGAEPGLPEELEHLGGHRGRPAVAALEGPERRRQLVRDGLGVDLVVAQDALRGRSPAREGARAAE